MCFSFCKCRKRWSACASAFCDVHRVSDGSNGSEDSNGGSRVTHHTGKRGVQDHAELVLHRSNLAQPLALHCAHGHLAPSALHRQLVAVGRNLLHRWTLCGP